MRFRMDEGTPACTFSVTVTNRGKSASKIGIAVTGAVREMKSQRAISQGSVQFHAR